MSVVIDGELAASQLAALGGKGRSLYQLGRLEPARVPAWYAVSDDVFAGALERAGVTDNVARILAGLDSESSRTQISAATEQIATLLTSLEIGPAGGDIIAAYKRLGSGYVAVRSSALDEDGAERSFAGCLDTSLYVRGALGLIDAVLRCWRSAFSERSLAYRARCGSLNTPIRVAVVVQRMVGGDVSGVLFSADPSSGDRQRSIVTSTWGLGEGVVSGRLACDTFVVDRSGSVLNRDLVHKSHAIMRDAERGAGTCEEPVAAEQRDAPSLQDTQLEELVRIGWAIEAAYGTPVDVEWTWTADGPFVLQARPITTGIQAPTSSVEQSRGTHRIWDNSNIVESYNGVTTPLTYSFARRAYSIVYRQAAELVGVPRSDIEANADLFEQMIGLLRGRVYYNLESWYQALKLLPGYRFNAEFMEQMMGVSDSLRGQPEPQSSAARRYLIELPRTLVSLAQLVRRFAGAEKLIARFYESFEEAFLDIDELPLDQMSFDELVGAYIQCEERIMRNWQAPIINDTLAMMFFGALRKALEAWGLGAGALHNDLMCGEGGLYSTEPTRDLLHLMLDVRQDGALCDVIQASSPSQLREVVEGDNAEPSFGWLRVRIASHVQRFGDRCIDELKLEEPTLRDDSTFIYTTLKGYLSAPPISPDELETRERALRVAAENVVTKALRRRPDRRHIFRWLVAGARRHVKHRENLRFARTRAFGLVRRIVVSMGDRLVETGRLDRNDDVFYLEMNELVAFSRGVATTTDLRGLAAVRRREYDLLRTGDAPPDRFETDGVVYFDPRVVSGAATEIMERAASGAVLVGVAASPGTARAPARVVTDPSEVELRGEVLVAKRTDPGWVPLFPSAAAIVVERGSVLSHSAIVAREFGIPCVVGLRGAMDQIADGCLVEVDGNAGTVTVVK